MNFKSNKDKVLKEIANAEKLALESIGAFVEAESKLRTPVDTGTLRRSISHNVDSNGSKVVIGTNIEYGPYVEKGSSKQKAQPYLTPAVEENRDKIKDILTDILKRIK